jgi:7-carboxy-7-deazaguanine synthase
VRELRLEDRFPLLFSPSFGVVDPRDLTAWLLESGIQGRLNLQIHKYVWGADARGV